MALIFHTYDCQFCEYRKKVSEREILDVIDYKCSYFDEHFQIGGYPQNISDFHCDIYQQNKENNKRTAI